MSAHRFEDPSVEAGNSPGEAAQNEETIPDEFFDGMLSADQEPVVSVKKEKDAAEYVKLKREAHDDEQPPTHEQVPEKRVKLEPANIAFQLIDQSSRTERSSSFSCDRKPKVAVIEHMQLNQSTGATSVSTSVPLTLAEKRKKSLKASQSCIKSLVNMETRQGVNLLHGFQFTPTMRKLNTATCFFEQHKHDNRSILNTKCNVDYKVNSYLKISNYDSWGLEPMPPVAAKLARVINMDADSLYKRVVAHKLACKTYRACQRNMEEEASAVHKRKLRSGVHTHASTQTNEVTVISPSRCKGFNVGTQYNVTQDEINTQTDENYFMRTCSTGPQTIYRKLFTELNLNQRIAMETFIALIYSPNTLNSYELNQRLTDILKLAKPIGPIRDSRADYMTHNSTMGPSTSQHYRNPSVDSYFVPNRSRNLNDDRHTERRHGESTRHREFDEPPIAPRYFGRGGLRRK